MSSAAATNELFQLDEWAQCAALGKGLATLPPAGTTQTGTLVVEVQG